MTYNLTKGINKFGEKGREAATAEVKQLYDCACFRPIQIKKLSEQQRARALELLIFLTEKRDGRIKARACANGSKQKQWMNKEEVASPIVLFIWRYSRPYME